MSLKTIIRKALDWRLERKIWRFSENREKKALKINGFSTGKAPGEYEYIRKWASVVRFPSPYAYRLFSQYCGNTPEILSENATLIINDTLNPKEFQLFYSDKNVFDRVFPEGSMPKTVLRRIKGLTLDKNYNRVNLTDSQFKDLLNSYDTLVIKPTVDSDSGRGVKLFHKRSEGFFSKDGMEMTLSVFENYGRDIILQEGVKQHAALAALNPESVNTLRIATYKSVEDGEVHVLSFVVRMGNTGSEVDNLHAGGRMLLIGKDGRSADYCIDQYGRRFITHNNIDLSKYTLQIPNYPEVIEFCKRIAKSMPELHLLQHDITVDAQGTPKCIEVNSSGFAMWIAQFMGVPALSSHTDEIINYVVKNHNHNRQVLVF